MIHTGGEKMKFHSRKWLNVPCRDVPMMNKKDSCFSVVSYNMTINIKWNNLNKTLFLFAMTSSCLRKYIHAWARFRNRLRRRFYARRGQTIDPSTIVNETGTRDMVITKTYKTNKILPESLAAPGTIAKECPGAVCEPVTGINEGFEKLVGEYVACIINKAAHSLCIERLVSLGNTNIIMDNSADNVFLSPKIANIAVAESLSNIVLESDIN
ncbi:uncharacterized protein LOC123557517 isoform X2 [Mercenaria mercenaria]|uniref:uncharacterized protein LOC123557517 isoform X2 n=1 Tax=Mercenaria mercenaria TaxID=6596 RepID=UPI00234EF390|nr:uncharacterized protein LOC123557517 isoform X2 [Mercenaria mercenaria]